MGFLIVQVPKCGSCGGVLKPEIVFFGDNVTKPTVELVNSRLDESDAMLVIGSSMEVSNILLSPLSLSLNREFNII